MTSIIYAALALVTWLLAPLLFAFAQHAPLPRADLKELSLDQCYALCVGVWVAGVGAWEYRQRPSRKLARWSPWLLAAMLGLATSAVSVKLDRIPYDFDCYLRAAKNMELGENPYRTDASHFYLYPPALAEAVMLGRARVQSFFTAASLAKAQPRPKLDVEHALFSAFKFSQVFAAVGCFFLAHGLGRSFGRSALWSALVSALLLAGNQAYWITISNGQANLLILASLLLALASVAARPAISGVAIAVGFHIKLMPVALVFPWLVSSRLRVFLAAVLGIASLFALEWAVFGLEHWSAFLHHMAHFPRNNRSPNMSAYAAAYRLVGPKLAETLYRASLLATASWMLWRFWTRERLFREHASKLRATTRRVFEHRYRSMGHAMDAIAFTLLASPLVWMHHTLLAVPIMLWALASQRAERPWLYVACAALLLPGIVLFPLTQLPLVGLVLLLCQSAPTTMFEALAPALGSTRQRVEPRAPEPAPPVPPNLDETA